MSARLAARKLVQILVCLSFLGASCGQSALGILPGVVNDPGNLSLRRAIFTYASEKLCGEMLRRSLPLKLREGDPAVGRFYPTSCLAQTLANNHLFIQFGGYGYAWTNLTKRVGFDASGAVEYDHDFLMDGSTMYVYFRQRSTTAAQFTPRVIEQPGAMTIAGGALGQGAGSIGEGIMKSELARGFTVIRESDGEAAFGLGVVEKGQRPRSPYDSSTSGRRILANERIEVHQNQRDYAGPFEVPDEGMALSFTVSVDGAPGMDVLVVPRGTGDTWLNGYTTQAAPAPPPAPPAMDESVVAGAIWRRTLALPRGLYYVVFDNTAAAGRTQPTNYAFDDRAGLVSYAIELGDAP
jgi:hypothetical protein